jgi:hypothetical protein
MNLQLNLISSMYVHQGGPLALQSSTQLNHGGLSLYNLWYVISDYVTSRRLVTDVDSTGTLSITRTVLSKCSRHIRLTSS